MEAYRILISLGYDIPHPKHSGCIAIIRAISYPSKGNANPKLPSTSIPWSTVLRWRRGMVMPLKKDMIAFAIVALAFTTIRRVGTFVPKSKKEAASFSWIFPKQVKFYPSLMMLLLWIPINKSDLEGRGTVVIAKGTEDECCPLQLFKLLMADSLADKPLFSHLDFLPTQA